MVDPTSDIGENVDEANTPECATCRTAIERDPEHQVVTWVDDEGLVQHRHFCSEECHTVYDD